jgi:hypothetical protein
MTNKKRRRKGGVPRKGLSGLTPWRLTQIWPALYYLSISVLALLSADGNKLATAILLGVLGVYLVRRIRRTWSQQDQRPQEGPPWRLLLVAGAFLPAAIRDSALGDMEEIYRKDVQRVGRKGATCWLCIDIVCSQYPKLKYLVLRALALYELFRRFKG